jgi:hypothetical protein
MDKWLVESVNKSWNEEKGVKRSECHRRELSREKGMTWWHDWLQGGKKCEERGWIEIKRKGKGERKWGWVNNRTVHYRTEEMMNNWIIQVHPHLFAHSGFNGRSAHVIR